ncbi:hypothetical protein BGZ94_008798 [Podila epigama]|nr:hypothetical protein BGZ94_008798 [Podila epigama]
MADRAVADASVATFVSSAIFTTAVSIALFIVFAIIRTRFPRVYSPKTYMGPERERPSDGVVKGLLGWVYGGRKMNEPHIRTYILRRQRYLTSEHHAQSLQATTVLVCGIPPGEDNIENLRSIFNALPGGVRRIWLAYEAKHLQKDCSKRIALINKLEVAECALIRGKLKHQAKKGRRASQGSSLSTNHLRNRPESAMASSMTVSDESFPPQKRPMHRPSPFPLSILACGGEKIDSIQSYRSELSNINSSIQARQQAGMTAMHANQDEGKMSAAFIQFNHQLGAHLAAQAVVHPKTLTMSPRHLEVHPKDVLWDNLGHSLKQRTLRRMLATVLAFLLIALWTIPVTFVASVAKLDAIVRFAPFLSGVYNLPKAVVGIIQGLLPPIGLAILMMLLPIILYKLAHLGGEVLSTHKTLQVVTSFHWFSVVHVLLVTTLANGIFAAVQEIKDNPNRIMEMLASTLPQASTFFLSFILLSFIQIPLMLLQIGPLIMYHVGKFLSSTPRQMFATERTMGSVDWGTTIPVHTIAFSIGLLYSTIQPLILPLMVIYFGLYYLAFRHMFLYVYRQPFDSGGLVYPRIVDQMYVAVILFELVMLGLFILQRASGQSVIMFILLIGSLMAISMSRNNVFKPLIQYLPIEAFEGQAITNAGARTLENGGLRGTFVGQELGGRDPSIENVNPIPAQEEFHEKAPYKDPHSPAQEATSREIFSSDPPKSPRTVLFGTSSSFHSPSQNATSTAHSYDAGTSPDVTSQQSNPSPLPSIRVESMIQNASADEASNLSLPGTPKTQQCSTTTTTSSTDMKRQTSTGSRLSHGSSVQSPANTGNFAHTPTATSGHTPHVPASPMTALMSQRQGSEYGGSLQVLGANQSIISAAIHAGEKHVSDALAFVNPTLWNEPHPVWLPQDPRGFAEIETMELTNAGLANTTEQATMDEKGRVTVEVGNRNAAPGDVYWE